MRVYESKKGRSTRSVRPFLGFKRYEFKTLLIVGHTAANFLADVGVLIASDTNIIESTKCARHINIRLLL